MASVRAGTFEEAGTTSSVVITKPTGTASGDLLIAAISTEDHTTVTCSSRPSGWTRLDGSDNGDPEVIDTTGGDMRLLVFKKTAGASEGTSYTFGLSASVYTSEAMVAIQDPGSVAEVLPLSESLSPGTARVDNVTLGTDEVAVSFFVGYSSGAVESLTNWSNVTGASRFVKSTATTRTNEETGTGTGGGAMDSDRWTSVVIRIAAAGGGGGGPSIDVPLLARPMRRHADGPYLPAY